MKILKAILAFFGMLFTGMAGGQGKTGGKAPRRFGLPSIALLFGWSTGWNWRYLAFLLFIPVLCIGYGPNSVLGAFVGHIEWLIRILYAILLSIPFYVFTWKRGVVAGILLVIAFAIRAGSIGYISWFGDILVEDIFRYGVLSGLVVFNVLTFKPKNS